MTNKQFIVGMAIVLAIVVAGYFFFYDKPIQNIKNGDQSSNGKINIDAVCEGALAYMTFPDGKAAEVYVAECKEGKHPEVIEQYKASLNINAGAEI